MAGIGGPTNKLSGDLLKVPTGMMCDTSGHESIPATRRTVGEVDSFGYEASDICEECFQKFKEEALVHSTSGICECCKADVNKLVQCRDWEEGSSGRVYEVCEPCKDKNTTEANELNSEDCVY